MAAVQDLPSAEPTARVAAAPFDPRLSFEAWRMVGAGLRPAPGAGEPGGWSLGDWLLFGRARYGRFYREAALVATALDPATLRDCAAVARRFAPARRRGDLTFAHHAEVAALADEAQDAWLAYAAAGGWSCAELRARLSAVARPAPAVDEVFRVAVERGQAVRWREAAERSRCGVDEWIARVLDRAAGMPAFGR